MKWKKLIIDLRCQVASYYKRGYSLIGSLKLVADQCMRRNCRRKGQPAPKAKLTEDQFIAMISEIIVVGGSEGWWVDTSATRHVCYDRSMFKTYFVAENQKV
ncbi:hypothetical protein MTR_0146s0070 [Medicago truncatula]|uniref:Uncharacterized protein n=1 Tax=Medicago truncatula TaxID=3880 RepID=A0A072TSN5_MEDTR|nr:hypothetical protein MTR_0146s0070 [Medicago truncatula]